MKTELGSTTRRILRRPSAARGQADHGWLQARHTFSFAGYRDPAHMGFRSLRVINEDRVRPGMGFSPHPHHDMEIFSYVLEGAIAHKDSLGNARTLQPGEIQLMSAGTGITHSEFNPSRTGELHLLQIWILPESPGLPPGYTEWKPGPGQADERKVLVISPDGAENSAVIHQDARVYRLRLGPGDSVPHELSPGRGLWLQVTHGSLTLEGEALIAGDGASAEDPGLYQIRGIEPAGALLFDLR